MKFIRNIFIFVGVIIVLVGALVAVTFDSSGSEMLPTHLYTDEYDSSEMIFKELNTSFEEVENDITTDLLVDLSDDVLNRFIYEKILVINEFYAPGPDCETDEECYVIAANTESEQGSIKTHMIGVYATFFDGASVEDPGRLVFNLYFEVDLNGVFTYETVLEAHFLFKDDTYNNEYFLEFDKVQMGNLRVPKSVFSWMINQADNSGAIDVDNLIEDLPIGELNISNMSYTIDKDEILTQIGESSEESNFNQLTQELLSISFDRELVLLDLQDEKFELEVQVSQLSNTDDDKTDIPAYLYDMHDVEVVSGETVYGEFNSDLFDPTAYLKSMFTQFLFNSALNLDNENQTFKISEKRFNKLIYSNANGFVDARKIQTIEISDTETKDIELGLQSIWFEFVLGEGENPNKVNAYALFEIAGIESLLVLSADVEYVDVVSEGVTYTEMHCVFNEITLGKDDDETAGQYIQISDIDSFKKVFSSIGDFEFGEFNELGDLIISPLKLTTLLSTGVEGDSIRVTSVDVIDNALELVIESPNNQVILDSFSTALNSVLSSQELVDSMYEALNPVTGSTEELVYNAIDDIQEDLENDVNITQDQITILLDGFEDMDKQSQTAFLNVVTDAFETSGNESILSAFETIFGPLVD